MSEPTTGFIHPLIHVNRVDRSEPFCPCHDDPWGLCPKWEQWGITPEQKAEAERKAEEATAYFKAQRDATVTGFPLQISDLTEERYGTCRICGRTARWWNDELAARWVHVQPMAVTGPHAHRAVVAEPDTEHKDAS